MKAPLLSSAVVCLCMSSFLYAQEPLKLSEAVSAAVVHNPELKKAEEAINKAKYNYKGSYSDFLPQISADAGYSHSETSPGTNSSNPDSYSVGLAGRQNLFSGLQDSAEIKQQKANLAIAVADLRAVKAKVSFELNKAFFNVLFSQEDTELSKRIIDRQKENVRLVGLRYDGGREHKGSFLRVKAAFRQAEFNGAEAKRELLVSKRDLARVIGSDEIGAPSVSGTLGSTTTIPVPNFSSLIRETPLYFQTEMRLKASEAGITVARSQFYPELSALGAISRQGNDFPLDSERWSVGVNASYPLFSGGRDALNLKAAKSDFSQQKLDFETIRLQLAFDLEDSFYRYQSATEKISVQQEFLEAAKVRAEIARSQYANGLLSFEDWDVIENDLIQQEKLNLSTRRDASIALANWNRIQGKGVFQ